MFHWVIEAERYAPRMTSSGSHDRDDWQPATSQPGELYTPEGQIRSARSLALGLFSKDPRRKRYRRSMQRTALMIVGLAIAVVVVAVVAAAIF